MDGHDEGKPNTYVMYKIMDNQYGWVMLPKIPTPGFEWVTCNFNKFDEEG